MLNKDDIVMEFVKKECTKCGKFLSLNSFHRDNRRSSYYSSCKECKNASRKTHTETPRGFFQVLWHNSKNSATRKSASGKRDLQHTLTLEKIEKIHSDQNGRCYYSKLPLVLRQGAEWMCSLERLNNTLGYIDGNVVLICWEFNSQFQSSTEFLLELCRLSSISHPIPDSNILDKPTLVLKKVEMIDENSIRCRKCNEVKPHSYGCSICYKCRRSIPHKLLVDKIAGCREFHRDRYETEFDFTVEMVKERFHLQKGLCEYTGIPLQFSGGKHLLSIERIDPKKTYAAENFVLIIAELNISRSGCWSKEKFEFVRDHLRVMYPDFNQLFGSE